MVTDLASHQHCVERIRANWQAFRAKRAERLKQQERHGTAAEKVAENILEDLFTEVLDWAVGDLNNQLEYADLVLTSLGVKHLLVEVKRPGALTWNRRAVDAALDQARRYAAEQKVKCVAISDGNMLYAADVEHGGTQDRAFISLDCDQPPETLWWLSVHGIYRPCADSEHARPRLLPDPPPEAPVPEACQPDLLHPKYHIPAHCFAYVGHAGEPSTWKLPYLCSDGGVDSKRLPKAIQSILSNYRGARVTGIPEADVPDILVRLARAAVRLGKMPHQSGETAPIYQQLAEALDQVGRSAEIVSSTT
jgi:hypothetical protein